jgi:hypothetical protein
LLGLATDELCHWRTRVSDFRCKTKLSLQQPLKNSFPKPEVFICHYFGPSISAPLLRLPGPPPPRKGFFCKFRHIHCHAGMKVSFFSPINFKWPNGKGKQFFADNAFYPEPILQNVYLPIASVVHALQHTAYYVNNYISE